MTTLAERTELAFWYYRRGVHRATWSTFDRAWTVGDDHGAPVGSVSFDVGILEAPKYWMRDDGGLPVIGLGYAAGVLNLLSDPDPLIIWPDGTAVGTFRKPDVWWGQQAIGKWLVQIDIDGGVGRFGGAWMWDTADAVVASVTQVRKEEGSYLHLDRQAGLDELLGWATLAFPLAVYQQLYQREVQDARGGRRRRDRTDLL